MITVLILVAILAPMLLVFSDRAIENISPRGTLANLSDEMDDIMVSVITTVYQQQNKKYF